MLSHGRSIHPPRPALLSAAYWNGVWNRSWVQVSSDVNKTAVGAVSTQYFLQRWIEMIQGRGKFPIKFQGMSFGAHENKGIGHAYWWQNTVRLPISNCHKIVLMDARR